MAAIGRGRRGGGAALPATLDDQDRAPDQGQAGAADQHQVGRAPEGHVLAEDPMPDVVEREADQRERRRGEHRHTAEGRVPVAADPDRTVARLAIREDDREEAGDEDPEQPGEDQIMRRVGERSGVATLVDVQRDVPVHADHGDQQRPRCDQRRQRGPRLEAGIPGCERGDATQDVAASRSVRPAEVQQGAGGEHRRGARPDHLIERGSCGWGVVDFVHLGDAPRSDCRRPATVAGIGVIL